MAVIIGYLGRRGKGKTTTMILDAYKYMLRGFPIYTNMNGIRIPHTKLTNEQILDMAEQDEFMNCVLMIDEIQVLFDSRTSNKKKNRNFLNFIQQIRKRGVRLLYTTQFNRRVDVGIREHLDIEARPRLIITSDKDKPLIEVTYLDLTSQEDVGYIVSTTKVYEAYKVFELFDTNERIERVEEKKEEATT